MARKMVMPLDFVFGLMEAVAYHYKPGKTETDFLPKFAECKIERV